MKKRFSIILLLFILNSCEFFESDSGFTRLDRSYYYISSILAPDSSGANNVTVFAGRIVPDATPRPAPSGPSAILNRVNFTLRTEYICEIQPIFDATIEIRDDKNKSHTLTHIGNGFYQNLTSKIIVIPKNEYHLSGTIRGNSFFSKTTIPEQIQFKLGKVDTLHLYLDRFNGIINPRFPIDWSETSKNPLFYRYTDSTAFFKNVIVLTHQYQNYKYFFWPTPDSLFRKKLYDFVKMEIENQDTNYFMFYLPERTFSGDSTWFSWFDRQKRLPLPQKTSIKGSSEVVGVFGSITTDERSFIAVIPPMTSRFEFPPGYVPPTKP